MANSRILLIDFPFSKLPLDLEIKLYLLRCVWERRDCEETYLVCVNGYYCTSAFQVIGFRKKWGGIGDLIPLLKCSLIGVELIITAIYIPKMSSN